MSLKQLSDRDLEARVERYHQGETEVCQELLEQKRHLQRVEKIARKKVKDSVLLWEDAAQEAHLKVLQVAKNGKFREGGVKEFYAWAAVVALHAIADFMRKEYRRHAKCSKNDTVLDNLASEFDLAKALEDADLVSKIPETIATIDRRYPKKAYQKLFDGLVAGKRQSQIATELGVSQGEISKRRKELQLQFWKELGCLDVTEIEGKCKEIRQGKSKRRDRTDTQW